MKRILFYILIVGQLVVILFLCFQFENIDQTGHVIKIQTSRPEFPVYGDYIDGDLYVEYEISKIAEDKWRETLPIDYNTRVYVLLEKDKTGIYRVQKASTKKIDAKQENEFVLLGRYQYHDTKHHEIYIHYGVEKIKHADQFGLFTPKDELVITLLIGKWGQHKVVSIEKGDS